MYNLTGTSSPIAQQEAQSTLTNQSISDLKNLNERQGHAISTLKTKMNLLINKLKPEDNKATMEQKTPVDFRDAMGNLLKEMKINTNELETLVDHINEII